MTFNAHIKVMPLKELLDPQGKAVLGGLHNMGLQSVEDVRVGKQVDLKITASSNEEALAIATDAAKKLLANPVMEMFEISIH